MTELSTFSPDNTAAARIRRWLAQSLIQSDQFAAYFEPLIQMVLPMWRSNGFRARVLEVRREQDDVYTLVIRPASSWKGFVAGQYVELMVEQDGVLTSRCFSLSSSPEHFHRTGLVELTIRQQQNGRITPWLNRHFANGGLCSLSEAKGDFVLPQGEAPLLMIAGGSGITPFRSMLQQLASERSERDVQLMYYARDEHSWLFRDELQRYMLDMPRLNVSFIDSANQGFISAEHLQMFCPNVARRTALLCGPTPMIVRGREELKSIGLPTEQVQFEYFGAAPLDVPRSNEGDALVSFARSGITADVAADKPDTLLNVAEQAGLKPVSGCRIGVCHQCICKKKSGVVFNTLTGRESDTGPEEIQLCVSVARGDLVLDL